MGTRKHITPPQAAPHAAQFICHMSNIYDIYLCANLTKLKDWTRQRQRPCY